jgi:hypothetical protein
MLRLSRWAQAHYWPARFLLIGLHVLLVMLAIRLGLALDLAGVSVPAMWPKTAAVIVAIGFAIYPFGASRIRTTFRRRKLAEGLVLTGSVVAIALLASRMVSDPLTIEASIDPEPVAQFTALAHPDAIQPGEVAAPQALKGKELRTWRRGLRAKVKTYLRTQQRKIDGVGASFLILAIVLLASFVELMVLALACSISCGGAEGLAVVVGLLGTAGVILLVVVGIGAVVRALRRSQDPENPNYERKRSPRKKILE